MLKILRKKGVAKKILWGIAIVIIISFGFFGTANYLSNPKGGLSHAGLINGRKVSVDDFEEAYQHTRLQAMMRYGENFFKLSHFLNLEAETWDRLILLDEAKKRNVKINDEEVVTAIQEFPFFQRDGQFDTLLYNDVLRYVFKIRPRDFEESIRESLKLKKLFQQETFLVTVTPEEIYEAYKKKNEKVQVSYVLFPSENFKNQVNFDESQAKSFYDTNKEKFFIPNSINVDYLVWELSPQTTDAEKAAISSQVKNVSEELKATYDIESVAKKHQLTVQSSGFFSLEQPNLKLGWPYDILLKAFALQPSQISEPLETAKGYYILQLKERKESYLPEFEEAKERVKEAMLLEGAKELAKQEAERALKTLKEQWPTANEEFGKFAKNLGFPVDQTPLFAREEYLPKIGISKTFQETAFSLNDENKLSPVIEIGKGYGFLYLEKYQPIEEAEFEKEKDKIKEMLLAESKSVTFNEFLTKLRLKANLVDNISVLKKAQNF